ncbi:hypothetical protein SH2C18_39600 [Clostridium sediminicola]|uniref:hypothetical protein n=1 Tax=Clostridium sediminicola TaxID=3114879 RepID=UPI0031F1C731
MAYGKINVGGGAKLPGNVLQAEIGLGENIGKGDLVDILKGKMVKSFDKEIRVINSTTYESKPIYDYQSIKLSSTKVLLIYHTGNSTSRKVNLTAKIIDTSGLLPVVTQTFVIDYLTALSSLSVHLLPDGRVILLYTNYDDKNGRAVLLAIDSNDLITAGEILIYSTYAPEYITIHETAIDSEINILFTDSYHDGGVLKLTLNSDNTISMGTIYVFDTYYFPVTAVEIVPNFVLVLNFSDSDCDNMRASVLTINENSSASIIGDQFIASSSYGFSSITLRKLSSDNKFLVSYGENGHMLNNDVKDRNFIVQAFEVTDIANGSITVGEDCRIYNHMYLAFCPSSLFTIGNDRAIAFYQISDNDTSYAVTLKVAEDNTTSVMNTTDISEIVDDIKGAVLTDDNSIIILQNYSFTLLSSYDKSLGIALQDGVGGETKKFNLWGKV